MRRDLLGPIRTPWSRTASCSLPASRVGGPWGERGSRCLCRPSPVIIDQHAHHSRSFGPNLGASPGRGEVVYGETGFVGAEIKKISAEGGRDGLRGVLSSPGAILRGHRK